MMDETECRCGHPEEKHSREGGCHGRDGTKFCDCVEFVSRIHHNFEQAKLEADFDTAKLYVRSVRVVYRYMPPTNRFGRREVARNLLEVFWNSSNLTPATVRLVLPQMMRDHDPNDLLTILEALQTAVLR